MKRMCRLVLPLLLLSPCPGLLEAASLKVSPAGFIVHNIIPGRPYDIYKDAGLQLTIYNDSAETRTYALSTHRPSEGGKWEKGYLEIPDPRWSRFEADEITINARSVGYARFHLRIPEDERYYNQHWVTTLRVAGKPGPGGIGVAIDVRAQIETQSRADITNNSPDCLIGAVPSTITLGAREDGKVVVFNNGAAGETYKLCLLADAGRFKTYIADGFRPLPDPAWLTLDRESLTIPAGGSRTFSLTASLPEQEQRSDARYEAIVFIEGKEATGFVRVRFAVADDKTDAGRREIP